MGRRAIPFLVAASVAVSACIPDPPDERGDPRRAMRHVSKQAPSVAQEHGGVFGGKVKLLGYAMDPERPAPGKTVRVTWYWQVLEPLGDDYRLFTHLVDAETGTMCTGCNFDGSSVDGLRALYPPSRWQAGDYVEDVQRIVLPQEIPFEEAEFRVGFYLGSERLRVEGGPVDDARRARGPRFETGYEPPPLPELEVPRAGGTITIDGRLDEPDWARAARTGFYLNATDGAAARPRTKARMLHDGEKLYVAFECEDDHIHTTLTKRDDHLWTQDAVEIFIDPEGRGRDYYELQVSPTGTIFDTLVHRHPSRDDAWDAGATAAAVRSGTLNDDSDVDREWSAELAIPLASLHAGGARPGDRWRLNLFRLDDRLGGRRAFLGWSPPLANTTHVPDRFGWIVFGPIPRAAGATGEAGPASGDGGEPAGGDGGTHRAAGDYTRHRAPGYDTPRHAAGDGAATAPREGR